MSRRHQGNCNGPHPDCTIPFFIPPLLSVLFAVRAPLRAGATCNAPSTADFASQACLVSLISLSGLEPFALSFLTY